MYTLYYVILMTGPKHVTDSRRSVRSRVTNRFMNYIVAARTAVAEWRVSLKDFSFFFYKYVSIHLLHFMNVQNSYA